MGVLPLHARVYLCADVLLLNKCTSLQPAYVIDLYSLTDIFTTYRANAVIICNCFIPIRGSEHCEYHLFLFSLLFLA